MEKLQRTKSSCYDTKQDDARFTSSNTIDFIISKEDNSNTKISKIRT